MNNPLSQVTYMLTHQMTSKAFLHWRSGRLRLGPTLREHMMAYFTPVNNVYSMQAQHARQCGLPKHEMRGFLTMTTKLYDIVLEANHQRWKGYSDQEADEIYQDFMQQHV